MNKRILQVLEVVEGEYYKDENVSGTTVDVTATDGRNTIKIEGIMFFDESEFGLDDFDEAVTLAREGEEGYSLV